MSEGLYLIVDLDDDFGPSVTGYCSPGAIFTHLGEAYEELVLTRGESARRGKPGRFALASVSLMADDPESLDRAVRMVGWTDSVAEAAARLAYEEPSA